jgi:hypothetical protein
MTFDLIQIKTNYKMRKKRGRGKQLSTIQILHSRVNSAKLRKEIDNLTGVDYIKYAIAVEKLKNLPL